MSNDLQTSSPSPLAADPMAAHRRRGMIFLCLAVAAVGFALTAHMGLDNNFVVEELGVSGYQRGVMEAIRESCGIWALMILVALAGLAEPLVGAAMLVLLAVGLGALNFVPSYFWLVVCSFVWSQGLHVWMPLPNSMAMAMAEPGREGYRVGQVRAAGAVGAGLGLVVALTLLLLGMKLRPMFLIGGSVALLAVAACLGIPRKIKTPGPRLVIRREYGLYYLLSFLEGWRKQIFVAFAGYMLVTQYDTPATLMVSLWLTIQVIVWFASPRVGRLIDRIGERPVLVGYFICLTFFFVCYALIKEVGVLYVLFVVDSAFFVFAMALTTYVSRIAPPAEYTATLSMGVACNHVGAVAMPLVGALLWHYKGSEWVFLIGAVGAAISAVVALRLPPRAPRAAAGD